MSDLSLRESEDVIVDKLTAIANAEQQKSSPRRGRRRGRDRDEVENQDEGEAKVNRLVVDPEVDAPIVVSFKLATYDFGSAAGGDKPEEGR